MYISQTHTHLCRYVSIMCAQHCIIQKDMCLYAQDIDTC